MSSRPSEPIVEAAKALSQCPDHPPAAFTHRCKRCVAEYTSAIRYWDRWGTFEGRVRGKRHTAPSDPAQAEVMARAKGLSGCPEHRPPHFDFACRSCFSGYLRARRYAKKHGTFDGYQPISERPVRWLHGELTEFVRAHNGCTVHRPPAFNRRCPACASCYAAFFRQRRRGMPLHAIHLPTKSPDPAAPHGVIPRGRPAARTTRHPTGPGIASRRCPSCFGRSPNGWACAQCSYLARKHLKSIGQSHQRNNRSLILQLATDIVRRMDPMAYTKHRSLHPPPTPPARQPAPTPSPYEFPLG